VLMAACYSPLHVSHSPSSAWLVNTRMVKQHMVGSRGCCCQVLYVGISFVPIVQSSVLILVCAGLHMLQCLCVAVLQF
jgi:hypothetical protein